MTKAEKLVEEGIQDRVRAKRNPEWQQQRLGHFKTLREVTSRRVKWALKGG